MIRMAPVFVFIILAAAAGVAHGIFTNRWTESAELDDAVRRLDQIPKTIGEWHSTDVPHDAEDLSRAGIRGYAFRRYVHQQTGKSVDTLIVCGRGGPISVHTPDVCYTSSGYVQEADATRKTITSSDNKKHSFWVAKFAKPNAVIPTKLEIYWGWTPDGQSFQAPDFPRVEYGREPQLFKYYVVRDVNSEVVEDITPTMEFLQAAIYPVSAALQANKQ